MLFAAEGIFHDYHIAQGSVFPPCPRLRLLPAIVKILTGNKKVAAL
jgi:hypothetical protein